jgi:hypothetical protein
LADRFIREIGCGENQIRRKDGLKSAPGLKVLPALSGVQHTHFPFEMALFADAIAGGRGSLTGFTMEPGDGF